MPLLPFHFLLLCWISLYTIVLWFYLSSFLCSCLIFTLHTQAYLALSSSCCCTILYLIVNFTVCTCHFPLPTVLNPISNSHWLSKPRCSLVSMDIFPTEHHCILLNMNTHAHTHTQRSLLTWSLVISLNHSWNHSLMRVQPPIGAFNISLYIEPLTRSKCSDIITRLITYMYLYQYLCLALLNGEVASDRIFISVGCGHVLPSLGEHSAPRLEEVEY